MEMSVECVKFFQVSVKGPTVFGMDDIYFKTFLTKHEVDANFSIAIQNQKVAGCLLFNSNTIL